MEKNEGLCGREQKQQQWQQSRKQQERRINQIVEKYSRSVLYHTREKPEPLRPMTVVVFPATIPALTLKLR